MALNRNQILGKRIELLGTSAPIVGTAVASTPILVCGELFNLGADNKTVITHVELVYSGGIITGLQMTAGSMATSVAVPADDWHGTATVMTTVPVVSGASIIFPDVAGALAQNAFADGTIFGVRVTVAGGAGLSIVANAYGFTTL